MERNEVPVQFEPSSSQYWFLSAPKDENDPAGSELAQSINRVATERETAGMPQRWQSYVYARSMSGRPNINAFAYGMAKRPSTFWNWYGQFEFSEQKAGLSSQLGDVYVNRLLSHRTFVEMIPDQGDLYQQRKQAQQLSRWTEAAFESTGFWDLFKRAGLDAIWFGSGFIHVEEGEDESSIEASVVPMDELLFGNPEEIFAKQKEVVRRRWVSRYELWAKFKDDPEAAEAILTAPSGNACFYFGPGQLNTADVIPLLDGWKLKTLDGEPGRHVRCVGNFTLLDEPYDFDSLPFEKFDFFELPGSVFGQGLAECTLPFSEWVDETLNAEHESDLRSGSAKWMVEENSNVNPDALGDTNAAVVTYLGQRPELATFEPIGQYARQRVSDLTQMAMRRVHVSETAVQGEVPKQYTSAVALEKYAAIEDASFLEMIHRIEEFVKRCALQYIRLAQKLKPEYTFSGRTKQLIDWPKLEMKGGKPLNLSAFNTGQLGQTVAGKIQKLQQLLQQGDISRKLYLKYLPTPSTDGLMDRLNAKTDLVDDLLDELVFGDDYLPPPSFADFDYAVSATEDRYSFEKTQETPQEVLDRLLQFRAHLMELMAQGVPASLPAPGLVPEGAPEGAPPPNGFGGGLPTESLNPEPTPNGLPAPPLPIPAAA